ncbi:TPA: thermonuclease family protein, partial [Klebsiella pneumoniae]
SAGDLAQGGITGRLRYNGQRLRLLSIDTPETYKPRCDAELTKGREATARLRELVANAQRIEVVDSGQADKYDRRLVHLLIDGRDVGQTLMAEGLAVEWRPGPNAWRERRRHWCGY